MLHPKHNSERLFSFKKVESHPANLRNFWQCKILQRHHLSRPKNENKLEDLHSKLCPMFPVLLTQKGELLLAYLCHPMVYNPIKLNKQFQNKICIYFSFSIILRKVLLIHFPTEIMTKATRCISYPSPLTFWYLQRTLMEEYRSQT